MGLWGENSVNADRPKHLNADEGVRSVAAAFQTERGWEVPLEGTDPEDGLSEVIAAQSNPAQGDADTQPSFYFPQAGMASGLTAKVGEFFQVFVRTVDIDAVARVESTTLTSTSKPAWATFTDFFNGVGEYTGTPTSAGTETFATEADDGSDVSNRSFQVVVSA